MARVQNHIPASFLHKCGLSAKELAKEYSVSLSTIYRWKKAAHEEEFWRFEHDFEINGRMLGILWSLGRDDGDRFVIRYRDKGIIEEVAQYFKLRNKIFVSRSRTGIQYRMHITGNSRRNILNKLHSLGWTERNADIRQYPNAEIDHIEFVRAYIELHSSLDKNGSRLRIYGNKAFIAELNIVLSRLCKVGEKKPQKVTNKTYALYYQSKREIAKLLPSTRTV